MLILPLSTESVNPIQGLAAKNVWMATLPSLADCSFLQPKSLHTSIKISPNAQPLHPNKTLSKTLEATSSPISLSSLTCSLRTTSAKSNSPTCSGLRNLSNLISFFTHVRISLPPDFSSLRRKSNFVRFLKYPFAPPCSQVGMYAHRSLMEPSWLLIFAVRPVV